MPQRSRNMQDQGFQASSPPETRFAWRAGYLTLLGSALILASRLAAYVLTGSVAVLSTVMDSFADLGMTAITLAALRYSLKPADHEHRYGHGKIEGVSALFQSALIAGASLFVLFEAVMRLAVPRSTDGLPDSPAAIGLLALATLLTAAMVAAQRYCLMRAPSLALEADSAHYAGDLLLNLGAIGILLAAQAGFPWWCDPLFALLAAAVLLRTACVLSIRALGMLLDRELPDAMRKQVARIVDSHRQVYGMHDLRTYRSGMRIFISFDMEVDPDMLFRQAHEIGREVENALLAEFPNAEILIHLDPRGDTRDSRHVVEGIHH